LLQEARLLERAGSRKSDTAVDSGSRRKNPRRELETVLLPVFDLQEMAPNEKTTMNNLDRYLKAHENYFHGSFGYFDYLMTTEEGRKGAFKAALEQDMNPITNQDMKMFPLCADSKLVMSFLLCEAITRDKELRKTWFDLTEEEKVQAILMDKTFD
jgi:hypothetical protein